MRCPSHAHPRIPRQSAFGPDDIKVMSDARERACRALNINGHLRDREVIAARIIDLARNGATDAEALSERVVAETKVLERLLERKRTPTEAA
jgi:hypothetical protein